MTVGLVGSVFASSAFAAGSATGTITEITSHTNYTNVFLDTSPTGSPGCSTKTYMSLSPDNKNQLAILLTAFALGNEVVLTGGGDCTVRSNSEDLQRIKVVPQ